MVYHATKSPLTVIPLRAVSNLSRLISKISSFQAPAHNCPNMREFWHFIRKLRLSHIKLRTILLRPY